MPRNFSWRHQYCVKPDIANHLVGICSQPHFGSSCDAPSLSLINRLRSVIKAGARFHLGKHEQPATARNDVDFTARASPPPCQNAESLCDQEGGGSAFGGNADPKCGLSLGSWCRL